MNRSTGLVNKLGGIKLNLTLNPYFTTDTTGWTATNAILSVTAGELKVQETGGVNPGRAYQDITTVIGRTYTLEFSFKKGTSATGSVKVGTTSVIDSLYDSGGLTDVTLTARQVWFIATATTTRITLQSDSTTATQYSYFDTVLCREVSNGFAYIMKGCKINIYSSPMPANADSVPTGTLLCQITNGGSGLNWEDAINGEVMKSLTETWKGTVTTTGVAAWFRMFEKDDNPALASTTASRVDGTISTVGGDMNMTSLFFLTGTEKEILFLSYLQDMTG